MKTPQGAGTSQPDTAAPDTAKTSQPDAATPDAANIPQPEAATDDAEMPERNLKRRLTGNQNVDDERPTESWCMDEDMIYELVANEDEEPVTDLSVEMFNKAEG